ncbi:MAG: class I SAM-dependent methyltransferase [Chloroflexota bacterium]
MSRGENEFVHLPGFAARLYDNLTQTRAIQVMYSEVARELTGRLDHGRLLDIGTGPGHLLHEIHRLRPSLELFGLDISEAMISLARRNLGGIPVDLRQGNIRKTDYADGFFDLITSTGSFYLWDEPVECLNEIHRILKPGGAACIYESYRDYDEMAFRLALQNNLAKETLTRRWLTPGFLKRQLRMTYASGQVEGILRATRFNGAFKVEKIILANLPVWLRIKLTKP